jgi:hypothetical protein
MTDGEIGARLEAIFAKHAAAAAEEARDLLKASGAAPPSETARDLEGAEIDAFVEKMLAWVKASRGVRWKAKRQLLIWYAYNIYCRHDRKIDLLPQFEKRLDKQGQRQLRQLLTVEGKYEVLGAEEGNQIRVNGRRLARKFKGTLSGEEKRRWDWLLAALVVGAWGAGATSTALAAGKVTYGAVATFKMFAAILAGITAVTAISLAYCGPDSDLEQESNDDPGVSRPIRHKDVMQAGSATPPECPEKNSFLRRRCYVRIAMSLEGSDIDGAVSRYRSALAIRYSDTDVPEGELKKSTRSYYELDSREVRLRLAALLSRHGRNPEAAAVMREQLQVRAHLKDAPPELVPDVDCGIAIALMMRAGETEEASAVATSCSGPTLTPYFVEYERALAYAATGHTVWAVRALGTALSGFLLYDEAVPDPWTHLGTETAMAVDSAQRLSLALEEAERVGEAVRLGEVWIVMEKAESEPPTPRIVVDVWRLLERPCATRAHSRDELVGRQWKMRIAMADEASGAGVMLKPGEHRSRIPMAEFLFDVAVPEAECFDIKQTVSACRVQGRVTTGSACSLSR